MKTPFFSLFLWIVIINHLSAVFQKDPSTFFDLSMEDLLNVPVHITTRTKMDLKRSPGVVRSYSRENLQSMGLRSIADLLRIIPGIQVAQYRAGHEVFWVRGVQSRYNNKILFLLDGIPIRDNYYGHFTAAETLPVEIIDRVEILNGPGSVVHGANAFAAVISVTTKSKGKTIHAGTGSFGRREGAIEWGNENLYGFFHSKSEDGFQPQRDFEGANMIKKGLSKSQKGSSHFGLFKSVVGEIEISVGINSHDYPQKYHDFQKAFSYIRDDHFQSVRWEKALGQNKFLELFAHYQNFHFARNKTKLKKKDLSLLNKVKFETLNTSLGGFDMLLRDMRGAHQWIYGVSYLHDRGDDIAKVQTFNDGNPLDNGGSPEPNLFPATVNRNSLSFFLQDLIEIDLHNLLTLGIRMDQLDDFEDEFNYRIGWSRQDGNFYSKLLFGTAFRIPSYRESSDIKSFNLTLQPEHLKTLELQLGILKEGRFDSNLTFFSNSYEDFIKELNVDMVGARAVGDEYYINAKCRRITGLEFSWRREYRASSLRFGFTHFFKAVEDLGFDPATRGITFKEPSLEPTVGEHSLPFLAKNHWTLSYDWRGTNPAQRSGIRLTSLGSRTRPAQYHSAKDLGDKYPALVSKNNLGGEFLVDIHTTLPLFEDVELRIGISNLLDQKVFSGPYGNEDQYDIEWAGRTYSLMVSSKF